jgi:hypothetical protein
MPDHLMILGAGPAVLVGEMGGVPGRSLGVTSR